MLNRTFDPRRPHRYVSYRRGSSEQQTSRSPGRPGEAIHAQVQRYGFPWTRVADYTDVAVSGRDVVDRPAFRQMLHDIRGADLNITLVLVDSYDRFGRTDVLADLRRELDQTYGVLLLTADTPFAAPMDIAGEAFAAAWSIRAPEGNGG